jgi:hypothetical protein
VNDIVTPTYFNKNEFAETGAGGNSLVTRTAKDTGIDSSATHYAIIDDEFICTT